MCYLLKKSFWWLLRRVKNLRSTTCKHRRKHYRKCDFIYRYLHIELIWCLLMVQFLQNNVIMKRTTCLFVLLAGFPWNMARTQLHLLRLTVKKLQCQVSYCDPQNLQYKPHPKFWPSHRRIFKTSPYYKPCLILETRRYIDTLDSRFIFYIDRQH